MVTEHMITELTQTVSNLKRDVNVLKEDNSYLYKKLEKAYGDRIELRAENHKLKSKINGNTAEEEECIACSAQITMAYTYAKPTKKVKTKSSTKKEDKYNPKTKTKKGRTARGKYTLPKKGFMR